jgi:hypothetical protein
MAKKATLRTTKAATVKASQPTKLQEILKLMGITENEAKNLIIKQATSELLSGLLSQSTDGGSSTVTQKFDFTTEVSEEVNRQVSNKVTELIQGHIASALVEVCVRETNKFGEPNDPSKPPMTLAELIESRTDKYMRRKVNKTTGKPSGAVGISRVEYLVNAVMNQVVSDYAENIVSTIEQKLTNKLSKDVVNHVRGVIEQSMLSDK